MNLALTAFFDTHRAGTATVKRRAHDQLQPVVQLCGAVDRHGLDLTEALHMAELTEHDPILDPKLSQMHTRLRALAQRSAALRIAVRELAASLTEVDGAFAVDLTNVQDMEAGAIPVVVGALPAGQAIPAVQSAAPA